MEAEGPDMVCGGFSRILVEPLSSPAPYRAALDLVATGERALLVKRVETGETAVLGGSGQWVSAELTGLDPAKALRALDSGHAALIEESGLFLDPVLPREKLLILGGGHVGRALAAITPGLGFAVTVGDERREFLEPERFPAGVETRLGSFTGDRGVLSVRPLDLRRDRHARPPLRPGVRAGRHRKPYRYAGLMGSRRKTRLMLEQVLSDGVDPARVDALYAPIGQEIGAETPEELAVAIAGELIAVRHGAECLGAAARAGGRGAAPREPGLEALLPLLPAGFGVGRVRRSRRQDDGDAPARTRARRPGPVGPRHDDDPSLRSAPGA